LVIFNPAEKMMYKKIVLAFLLISLYSVNAVSQNTSGILESKLQHYRKTFPSEKLYVHTDKNFYTAGEIVWFKIYNCTDSSNIPAISSKVVYVELLDDHNRSVLQAKISMDRNSGSGSLELPLTLNSGNYSFRAYTNWMKNFSAEYFFEKKIAIVNPFKNLPPVETLPSNSIVLFPEGGNLVNGILSQIGFKINSHGRPVSGKGFIIDENNDTAARFEPFRFGLGSFYFTPDIQHHYKAVYLFDDNSFISKPLPQIFTEGYVMHLDEENQKIRITVRTNVRTSSEIFLIAQNHQNIKAAKQSSLTDGIAIFSVNKADLGPGVSQLTVFNQSKQPVCERLFFIQPSQDAGIKATVAKETYTNREQVRLSISSASAADLSVSVFQLDSLQTVDGHNINSYFWIESELNGEIENPQYYLSGESEEIKKATDHLMLTHGWRRFNWDKILNQPIAVKFQPENLGQTIVCKITDPATGIPVKNVKIYLSIPETTYKLFPGLSNDSGMISIRTNEYYGKGELILQTVERSDNYKIEVIKPFAEQFTTPSSEPFKITETKKPLLENYSIGMQSQYIYTNDSIQKFSVPELKDSLPFFGKGQNVYLLDDYTRFTTMEEVLREYVREINVGLRGGNLKFKLLNEVQHEYFSDNILVLIDGVPLSDPDKMFSVDPMKIRRIDIFPRSYILGTSLFYGLANFSTYKENHENIDIDPKAVVIDYEGLQIKREFYSPDYSNTELWKSRIPDLRNTLYWSPDITGNQQVQFYTSDNKGKYIVVVQGMNSKGEPVNSVSEFAVR
jgi:hypothetical protein